MKIIRQFGRLVFVATLLVCVSCSRPKQDADEPPSDSKPKVSEPAVVYQGTVELVKQVELDGIKCMAYASGIDALLVSDGTVISNQNIDLEILSTVNLRRVNSFSMTDAASSGYPWASESLVVAPNGSMVLLYNQYIDLNSVEAQVSLDIQPVVGRPNVYPNPWAISPNGKLGLVCVGSFWSHEESTLATFDLETGKSLQKIASGKSVEYGAACFLDNSSVVAINDDGIVTLHNLVDGSSKVLSEKLAFGWTPKGRNLVMQPFGDGKNLLVTGDDEIVVINFPEQKVAIRHPSSNGNAVLANNGSLIVWQNSRWKDPENPDISMRERQHLLMVASAHTGKIVGEYEMPTFYEMIVLDDSGEYVYGAQYGELHKLKLDLSPIATK